MHRSLLRRKGEIKLAGKVKTICEEKIAPVIEQLGYELIEVEYAKKSDGMNLTFFIDSDNGINIDDCEKVSKALDPVLEELNPTDDAPYILSISSPGIDRPLKNERDFKRNIGKEISITTFAKIDGKKNFEGVLDSFDEKTVTILINNERLTLDKEKIAHIVPVIKF